MHILYCRKRWKPQAEERDWSFQVKKLDPYFDKFLRNKQHKHVHIGGSIISADEMFGAIPSFGEWEILDEIFGNPYFAYIIFCGKFCKTTSLDPHGNK